MTVIEGFVSKHFSSYSREILKRSIIAIPDCKVAKCLYRDAGLVVVTF